MIVLKNFLRKHPRHSHYEKSTLWIQRKFVRFWEFLRLICGYCCIVPEYNCDNAQKQIGLNMINKLIELLPIIPCQEATRLMSLSMEKKLSLKQRFNLMLHLKLCSLCVQFQKQIESMRKILKSYIPLDERKLSERSKTKIKYSLKNN